MENHPKSTIAISATFIHIHGNTYTKHIHHIVHLCTRKNRKIF